MTARIPENVSTDWTIVTINAMPPRDPNDDDDDDDAAIAVATGEPDLLAVMITRTTADAPQTDGWGPPGRPSGLKRRGRRNRTR